MTVPRADHVSRLQSLRICLIGASHYDDDSRLFFREAVCLSKRYSVEVLAAGERSLRVVRHGVTVTTCGPRRRATYLRTLLKMYLHLRSIRFDVLHCFEPESLVLALIVSRLASQRPLVIYDAHEYFPSLITGYFTLPGGLAAALESLLGAVELFFASFCDAFVVVNEDLARRFSVFHKPLVIVRNLPSLSWFDDARIVNVLEDVTRPVVISAAMRLNRGLEEILQARSLLDRAGVEVCFVLAGLQTRGTPQKYDGLLGQKGQSLRVVGWIEYDILPSFLRRASIGLALYTPARASSKTRFQTGESTKLYDYMAAGLPIVATDLPGIRALVSPENCAVLVNPGEADAIAGAITKLLYDGQTRTSMAKRARQAAEREYNWEMESGKLMRLYEEIEKRIR